MRSRIQAFWQTVLLPFFQLVSVQRLTFFSLLFLLASCLSADLTLPTRVWILAGLLTAVLLTLVLARQKRFWYRVCLPLLLGALLGSGQSFLLWEVYAARLSSYVAQSAVLETDVEVEEVVYTNAYMGSYICRFSIDRLPYHVLVETDATEWTVGQVLTGEIQLCLWDDLEDGFDEAQYYRTKNVLSAAQDLGLTDTGKVQFRWNTLFLRWNAKLSALLSAHVTNDGLPLAMLLGNREQLSDVVQRDFRRAGILHLLAVSGTHFSALATMAERWLKKTRLSPGKRNGILGVLAVFYMLLTGMSGSVRRAGCMFLLGLACRQFGHKVQYFSSLNISCLCIVLFDPIAALDVGLHLSYLAVCGCLLTIRVESSWQAYRQFLLYMRGERIRFPKGWRRLFCPRYLAKQALSMLLLNLIITCLTLPLSWLYFGELSLASLLTNLIYISATSLLMSCTILYLLTYPLKIGIPLFAPALSLLSHILEVPAAVVSQIPHIVVSLRYPFVPLFLIPSVLAVCCLPYLRHKLRGILRAAGLLLLMLCCIWATEAVTAAESTMVYQNHGRKDGFVLHTAGKTLLVDVSDGSNNFTNMLLVHAKAQYATEIDGYMLTHYHNRHLSTLQKLADNWILRKLYLPAPMSEAEEGIYTALCRTAAAHHIPVETFGESTTFGHLTISVGPRTWLSRSTHPITGLQIVCGEERVVYTSCSYGQTDEQIVDWMEDCTVGIFGAHSPVHKKPFTLDFANTPELLIWNGDGLAYYTGVTPAAKREYVECALFRLRFAGE